MWPVVPMYRPTKSDMVALSQRHQLPCHSAGTLCPNQAPEKLSLLHGGIPHTLLPRVGAHLTLRQRGIFEEACKGQNGAAWKARTASEPCHRLDCTLRCFARTGSRASHVICCPWMRIVSVKAHENKSFLSYTFGVSCSIAGRIGIPGHCLAPDLRVD